MVQHVQSFEFTVLDFFIHLIALMIKLNSDNLHNIAVGQQRSKFKHVSLIV